MQRKKVLIIPSWYPNQEQIALGTFYREQAQILEKDFDIRILFGIGKPESRTKILYNLAKYFIFPFDLIEWKNNYLLAPPEAFAFNYKIDYLLSEGFRLKVLVKSYIRAYEEIINQGFLPDIIHGQSTLYGGIVASIIGNKYKIPVVITEHQHLLFNIYNEFRFNEFKKALETVNKVAVVSQHQARMILMNDINCNPIVVGNLVNENKFTINNIEKADNKLKILTVAYSSYIKDTKTFFKAIAELVNMGIKDIQVTIINPSVHPQDQEIYKSYAKELNVIDFCEWVQGIALDDMPSYYQKCDVFVSTAIAETFGLSICEAMFCGKPVVATSNGGIDDILTEDNGIKVNLRDHKGIADAILIIKNNPGNFSPEKIRQSVLNKFGTRAFTEKMVHIYNQTIDEYSHNLL
jgi:glycosyltransferase involved in cell wall biosynthesis